MIRGIETSLFRRVYIGLGDIDTILDNAQVGELQLGVNSGAFG